MNRSMPSPLSPLPGGEGERFAYGAPILQVHDVSLVIDGQPVLRGVDFEVRDLTRPGQVRGQVVALLGPSGIGKTRLLRLLAGLDAPTSGTVLVGDPGVPVTRGAVGVVAQHCPLFANRSVLGNLRVAARMAGLSRRDGVTRAQELLARFGLLDRAQAWPAQLSGGQRQRVAIAQQALCSEHFLLMDEPFSGLDPLATRRVLDQIGRAHV